jgi:hypothetical protein
VRTGLIEIFWKRHPPTGCGRNLTLGFRSFSGGVPMIQHIAQFCDFGIDALLLRLESGDRSRDDFVR